MIIFSYLIRVHLPTIDVHIMYIRTSNFSNLYAMIDSDTS